MRPEGLKDQNKSSLQASWPSSLPAFKLAYIFRTFVIEKSIAAKNIMA